MSQFSLTLKPAQIEIILKPNSSYVQAYEITNNSSETLLLSSSVSSWIPADNLGTVTYLNSSESHLNFSLSNSDLKLGQEFLLNPGQKKQLVLKINNPTSEETDLYSTFFITQKPLNNALGEHQNLAKIGSHILASTTHLNSFPSNLQISQFSLKPKLKDIFTPIDISGEIINNGEHYSQINGQITVYKGDQLYWQQNLFPYTVVAKNSRLLHCLNSQNESTNCHLKVPLWPGTYKGTISLSGNASKYEYSFQFFVFPYSIIIFIIFLFSLLFFVLRNKQSVSSTKQ